MLVFKVKPNTEQFEFFKKYWDFEAKWREAQPKIKELLGAETHQNLAVKTTQLLMVRPPQHLKDQFTKNATVGDFKRAKTNSQIGKDWVNFCRQCDLDAYTSNDLLMDIGIYFSKTRPTAIHPPMQGEYYFEASNKSTLEDWLEHHSEWVEPVPEATLLRIRADFLEEDTQQHD